MEVLKLMVQKLEVKQTELLGRGLEGIFVGHLGAILECQGDIMVAEVLLCGGV